MADVVSSEVRSRMMAGIRGRDTKPELTVRRFLHRAGFRYRISPRSMPGRPDLVLPKWRTAVFIHGCFWHWHESCRYFRLPATRPEFWREKLQANRARDSRSVAALIEDGWRVAIVWECALRKDAPKSLGELGQFITSGETLREFRD